MKNILSNYKALLFLILILFAIFHSLKNGSIVSAKFFFSNLAIRQGFFEENNIKYKGTHEPGRRYIELLNENYNDAKNLRFFEILNSLSKVKNFDITETEYNLEYKLIKKLKDLSRLPLREKKISAIYLSNSLQTFWNLSCDKLMLPFIVPAITNIVMIDGLPSENIKSCYGHRREYGYSRYLKYNKKTKSGDLDSKSICEIARDQNIKKVIEIYRSGLNYKSFVHNCEN